MTIKLRGADLVVRALAAAGTTKIFTLSGNHIMPIFDASIGSGMELVHVRHEAAAVHMADAWGRLTGTPGVALVTGGPGHANAVGALYTALAAEAPMVLLSGHAPLDELGLGSFQEMRQAEMAAPAAKASWTATSAAGLGRDIATAFRIARSGRPGPVHVSLPSDLLEAEVEDDGTLAPVPSAFEAAPSDAAVPTAALVRLLGEAASPLVIFGPQFDTRGGRDLVTRVADTLDAPAVVMASPRGINDPSLGAFASVLAEADLVVLLGKPVDFTLKFGRAPTIAAECRVALVEPDAALRQRAAKVFGDRLLLLSEADPTATATALAEEAPAATRRPWRRDAEARIAFRPPSWRTARAATPGLLHPAELCLAVADVVAHHPDAVVIADGGEIGQWAQACLPVGRRLINGVAGSIGASLPFAIAARLAAPGAPVIALLGDGTFGFHMAEIDTAVRHGAPFVAVIGNDARWNAEHQIQVKSYGAARAVGCDLEPTAYDAVAVALGGQGRTITDRATLITSLREAIADARPWCLNVRIESIAAPVVRMPT